MDVISDQVNIYPLGSTVLCLLDAYFHLTCLPTSTEVIRLEASTRLITQPKRYIKVLAYYSYTCSYIQRIFVADLKKIPTHLLNLFFPRSRPRLQRTPRQKTKNAINSFGKVRVSYTPHVMAMIQRSLPFREQRLQPQHLQF